MVDLEQIKADIAARKAMPAWGPQTSIERIKTINATLPCFSLKTVEALAEALEKAQQHIARQEQIILNQDESLSIRRGELEEAQRSANISNQWKPDVCPITSRKFFMWIEHPEFGYVPTYGGPYDSYTIPTRDSDGEFSCERYDHDVGGWVDGECIGLYLVDDDELCDVDDLKSRIAELEPHTVKLPKLKMLEDYLAEAAVEGRKAILLGVRMEFHRALTAAGIKWGPE